MMLETLKNIESNKKDLQKFGILLGTVLVIISTFFFWQEKSYKILLTIGTTMFVLANMRPVLLKPIYRVWMALSTILGWVMTRLVLAMLFYVVVTPIGLILRFFGKDFLDSKLNVSKKTYWNITEVDSLNYEEYEKQF